MEPPTIYLPEARHRARSSGSSSSSRGSTAAGCPASCVPIEPGDEIELSREHVVTVSATTHTVPSLGFVVWERRRKLKPEYQDSAGEQIRDLRLGGTEVTEERAHAAARLPGRQRARGARRLPGHVRGRRC